MSFSRRNSILLSLVFCISAPSYQALADETAPAAVPPSTTTTAVATPAASPEPSAVAPLATPVPAVETPVAPIAAAEAPATPVAAPSEPAPTAPTAPAAAPAPQAAAPPPVPTETPAAAPAAASEEGANQDDSGKKKKAASKTKKINPREDDGYYKQYSLDEHDKHEFDRHKEQGGGYYGPMPTYKAPPPEAKPILPAVEIVPVPVAVPLKHDGTDRKFKDDPGAVGSITFMRHATQAKELLSTGHYDLAKKHFKEALRINPDDMDLLPGYWETCEKTSDWSESVRTLEHMFSLNPAKEKEYCWAHGEALYELRRWDRAVPTLRKAVTFGRNVDQCHDWLLKIALQQRNTAEQATEYAAILKLRPTDYKMHVDFGNLLETQGRHNEALVQYKAAATAQPDGALMARIAYMMMSYNKDWNGAMAMYNRATQADPKNAAVYQKSVLYCQAQLDASARAAKATKSK